MSSISSPVKVKTVLVVDDEDGTRRLISLILREGGYAVLEAADSESAARIHQRHQGQIDLLLTDVGLPGPSGCDLAAALRQSEPNLQVLFMSGMHQPEEDVPFLRKPFGVAELLRQVQTTVGSARACL
jgi:CheY-like chemotaxis protein